MFKISSNPHVNLHPLKRDSGLRAARAVSETSLASPADRVDLGGQKAPKTPLTFEQGLEKVCRIGLKTAGVLAGTALVAGVAASFAVPFAGTTAIVAGFTSCMSLSTIFTFAYMSKDEDKSFQPEAFQGYHFAENRRNRF